jgi:anti-sigma-K factor RskA
MKDQRMTSTLSDERVLELIEAYGADPAAFPEAMREAAARRMAEAPGLFAKALDEARRLDQFLDLVPATEVSASLRDSLLARAPNPKRAAGVKIGLWRFLPGWLPAGAVASLVMGLVIGVNVSLPASVASAQATDES